MPCATGPDAWTHQYDMLRQLFLSSEPRLHDWVDDPQEADLIFLTNVQQKSGSALEENPWPKLYPEKCFLISEQWEPPFLMAGIYANAPRSILGRGRFRTGSYALHHPDFRNPFVDRYDYAAAAGRRQPDLLASFLGRNCHPVRERLFAMKFRPDEIRIEDTSDFNAFLHDHAGKEDRQRYYFETCLRSKFILCPRGAGPNSIRLFEALKLGLAPVIISDAWVPCEGPQWEQFAIFVAEENLSQLGEILRQAEPTYQERGRLARLAHEKFFSRKAYFNYLVAAAASALSARIIPERLFISCWPVQRLWHRARHRSRQLAGTR